MAFVVVGALTQHVSQAQKDEYRDQGKKEDVQIFDGARH